MDSYVCVFLLCLGACVAQPTNEMEETFREGLCLRCISQVEMKTTDAMSMVSDTCDQLRMSALSKGKCISMVWGMCSESPRECCALIGQCADDNRDYADDSALQVSSPEVGVTVICRLCFTTTSFIHNFLKNPQAETILLGLMKEVCHMVPVVSGMCVSLVEQYGPMVFNLAKSLVSPRICKSLFSCAADEGTMFGVSDGCAMCQLGVGVVYDTIRDPELESRISQYSKALCEGSDDVRCPLVALEISLKLKQIAKQLRNNLGPMKTFCQDTGICPAGSAALDDFNYYY